MCCGCDKLSLLCATSPEFTRTYLKRPFRLSMIAGSCAFCPVVQAALDENDIARRALFKGGNIEATTATVRNGRAITT